jgi:hypothetical protein
MRGLVRAVGCITRRSISLTRCGLVLATLSVGLLDGEASTKGTGNSSVTAANSADVSSGGTNAVELLGHLNVDLKVLFLGLGQAKRARDVVGYLERSEGGDGVASLVHVALERTSSISVDLVDGDLHDRARRDSSHAASSQLVLGLLTDIDVAIDLGTSTGVDNVLGNLLVTDDGSILLARRDGGAVAGNGGINQETLTGTRVTNSGKDGGVRVHSGDESG